ncbi:LPS translocon maturation chaperone LptM [Enterobacteriaceae bacterium C23F]
MNNFFRPLILLAALTTLAGCGLKGPLYFPPADKADKTAAPPTQPVNPGTQSTEPTRNDRGDNGGPTQVNY